MNAAHLTEQAARVRRAPTTIGKLWMVLLQAQRPMRRREVRQTLDAIMPAPIGPCALGDLLTESKRRGYLTAQGHPHRMEYAVTPACNVPPSIRLADVLEAVQS